MKRLSEYLANDVDHSKRFDAFGVLGCYVMIALILLAAIAAITATSWDVITVIIAADIWMP